MTNAVLRDKLITFAYIAVAFLFCASLSLRVNNKEVSDNRTDIRAQYEDAVLLTEGINPYSRISDPSLPQDRYTFYFPGFLLGSATGIKLGLQPYEKWLKAWRFASISIHFSIGLLIFYMVLARSNLSLAIIASFFWYTNRWSLALFRSGQIDGLAILLLLLSFNLWTTRKNVSCLLFGASLAVKQMAVFLLPLYLIWSLKGKISLESLRAGTLTALKCLLIPFLICVPFVLWNAQDFFHTTIFPLKRDDIEPFAMPAVFGLTGVKRKIPFFLILILIYAESFQMRLRREVQVLLVLFAMISFTNAYFSRHFNWLVPFLLLSASLAVASKVKQGSAIEMS